VTTLKFGGTCLTRSRPLARSQGDLYSGGAEYILLAVSQTAQVFVTTPIFRVKIEDEGWRMEKVAAQQRGPTMSYNIARRLASTLAPPRWPARLVATRPMFRRGGIYSSRRFQNGSRVRDYPYFKPGFRAKRRASFHP
jgi:hypothetical protein